MGFAYLDGENWLNVTREERLFCSYLYWDIASNEKDFITWLNTNTKLQLDVDSNWEIGYEVCFYRDLLKLKGKPVRGSGYPPKRTFDLCLFSEDTIVVIEAKVQQRFSKTQIDDIQQDIGTFIPKLKKEKYIKDISEHVVLLASSWYLNNLPKHGHVKLPSDFIQISWRQIHELYKRKLYIQADDIYRREHIK